MMIIRNSVERKNIKASKYIAFSFLISCLMGIAVLLHASAAPLNTIIAVFLIISYFRYVKRRTLMSIVIFLLLTILSNFLSFLITCLIGFALFFAIAGELDINELTETL